MKISSDTLGLATCELGWVAVKHLSCKPVVFAYGSWTKNSIGLPEHADVFRKLCEHAAEKLEDS